MNASSFRIIAAPHTPFHPQGDLKLEAVPLQARLLKGLGVDGVFVAGSTGEASSLTAEERVSLAEVWCGVAQDCELEVIIQVGHTCQADGRRLAAHAQKIHADAVAAFAPYYFKPRTVDDLIGFLAPVAQAASDLPFYFYDIPVMTGVRLPMAEFLATAKPHIPNLVGLKYSNDDLVQLQQCVQLHDGEFEVLFGSDEALLAAVALGVRGAVGSTYNFAAPLYRRMRSAFAAGDLATARSEQARSVEMVRAMEPFGVLAATKAAVSMLGVECGPVRPPLRNLDAEQVRELRRRLERLAIFDREEVRTSSVNSVPATRSSAT